jgi:hypothetical protein
MSMPSVLPTAGLMIETPSTSTLLQVEPKARVTVHREAAERRASSATDTRLAELEWLERYWRQSL